VRQNVAKGKWLSAQPLVALISQPALKKGIKNLGSAGISEIEALKQEAVARLV
jgi:hypothetical protein